MEQKLEFCADVLSRMEKEVNKRDDIYKQGVDLSNYQNEYLHCLIDSLVFILGDESFKDDIEWYLFELSDDKKIYWIDGVAVDVTDPLVFLKTNSDLKNRTE